MQTQKTQWLFLVLLMAAVFFSGLFFGKKQAGPIEETPREILETPAEEAGKTDEESESGGQTVDAETMVLSSDGKTSYRVKSGKRSTTGSNGSMNAPTDRAPRLDIDWQDEFVARDVFESALAGDEDDVISVSDLLLQCLGMATDEKHIVTMLNRMSDKVKAGNPIPTFTIPSTGENLQFASFMEFEEFQLKRFDQCQATRGMFDKAARDRLEEQARNGSITARFLYAMWLPDQNENTQAGLIEWITYQSLAWDFTWANIREGEPLGLLAYGRSLEQSGTIYFTPRHYSYGPALILASQKCGLNNQTVDQKVSNLTSYWAERKMTQRLNHTESLSDQIADMFCR
jgi:hypothetical protein